MTATRSLSLVLLGVLASASLAEGQMKSRPRLEGSKEERSQQVFDLLGPEHVVREAWRETGRYFFDKQLLGQKDWDGALRRALEAAAKTTRPSEVHTVINTMLGELKVSHLALLEHDVWARELAVEFTNRKSVRAGCELTLIRGRYFATGVIAGGPAAKSGLREGDEVLSLDGLAPDKSPHVIDGGHDPGMPGPHAYCLRVSKGQRIALKVRRHANGAPLAITLRPAADSLIAAAKRSVRIETVGGARIGVIHLPHYIHREIFTTARDALRGPLADADALVLDVRGRGGSSWVVNALLRLFSGRRAIWDKPVVLLTDRGTRSAKEIFAYHWKKKRIGPIVGERTQGACIGCRFLELSDGSVLCVPVADVRRLSGGKTLEGIGVEPTFRVCQHPLPYRNGQDRILKAGLRQASQLARGVQPQPL
ncbi:MAG: PDZ domain-containing protein [Planctomycetes bacterium]|nr:PDZ domain-containing protein [Planctomycetota bacterium]